MNYFFSNSFNAAEEKGTKLVTFNSETLTNKSYACFDSQLIKNVKDFAKHCAACGCTKKSAAKKCRRYGAAFESLLPEAGDFAERCCQVRPRHYPQGTFG